MKFKNVNISKKINLALGFIILLVVILGVVSMTNSTSLWRKARGLYENPLTVQRAIGALEGDIYNIRLHMKEVVLDPSERNINERSLDIDIHEEEAYKQLDIIYNSYLGGTEDIDNVFNSIVQWKSIREETFRLYRVGRIEEALPRSMEGGVGVVQAQTVFANLSVIKEFAVNKADQFLTQSEQNYNNNILQLGLILAGIIILSVAVAIYLRRVIISPLKELTFATEAFKQGKLDARSKYESKNEFGVLSNTFNDMTAVVQAEIQNKEKMREISQSMFESDDFHGFCQLLLNKLIENTGSQAGAIYLLNEENDSFEHFESIGFSKEKCPSFSKLEREGELGAAIAKGEVLHLTDIPDNAQIMYSTVSGELKVKETITIPIFKESNVVSVISLANIKKYSKAEIELINNITNELSARLSSILTSQQIIKVSKNVEKMNEALSMQTKEMERQTDELLEQNIELEMQKKQLTEATQLKSSFLSNMSHELRTPLNSVIALSSVLRNRLDGKIPKDEYSYLEVIERNGKQLLLLVNDLLDLSRIEAGKEEINFTKFNIKSLVGEIIEMIGPQANDKSIELINDVSEDFPEIVSDIDKCMHILLNIIGNAVKFTDEGSVRISSVLKESEINILVSDSGIGIAHENLDIIFDEFRQADESSSRKKGGTGLGLAIAKKYAMILGGDITVESTLEHGSTFTLILPLETHELTSMQKDVPTRVIETSFQHTFAIAQTKNVLIVDDSEPAVIQTTDILEEQGYHVHIARNGNEAVEQIGKHKFDGMILDLMMPEMDGFQVLKSIRNIEKNSKIPVLILSAKHITKEELSFLKSNNVLQLIQKGAVDKNELVRAVAKLLRHESSNGKEILKRKSGRKASGKPVVLVVEDNSDNMLTVKAILEDAYEIIEATDGIKGVSKAKQAKPDIILMDISLPQMDGFRAFSKIRSIEELQQIPIIALTARAMSSDRDEILNYGFDGYVSKPIDKDNLKLVMRRFTNGD